MKKAALAWLLFLGGLALILASDYLLRIRDGDVRTGGLHDAAFFLVSIGLGGAATYLAYAATAPLGALWKRIAVVALQVLLGLVLFAFVGLAYVLEAGIDSL